MGNIAPDYARARGGVLQFGVETPPREPKTSRCGAKTRKGAPCRNKPIRGKDRCKFHGGGSTGPKTREGRDRIAEAQRQRWANWREARLAHADEEN